MIENIKNKRLERKKRKLRNDNFEYKEEGEIINKTQLNKPKNKRRKNKVIKSKIKEIDIKINRGIYSVKEFINKNLSLE